MKNNCVAEIQKGVKTALTQGGKINGINPKSITRETCDQHAACDLDDHCKCATEFLDG